MSLKIHEAISVIELENALRKEFHFDAGSHVPIEPPNKTGQIIDVKKVPPISISGNNLPDNIQVYDIIVEDPYVTADPEGYHLVSSYVQTLEERLRDYNFDAHTGRHEASLPQEYNLFTRAWFHSPDMETGRLWRDLVPSAEALDYLLEPDIGKEITNHSGESTIITREAALQLRFVHDAIGIRDRSAALREIAETHLGGLAESGKRIKWLSLASGTAKSAITAAVAVERSHGAEVDLVLADIDSNALDHVEENAQMLGFNGQLTTVRANIVSHNLRERLATRTQDSDQQYDVVENMGFKEYLPQEGDEMGARRGKRLPQASEFTQSAYSFVKPGGILISGNMVLPRSQTDFVFGVVDWPLINARSEESILRVYEEAGILNDPRSQIELFRVKNQPTDIHIYDIVLVRKPLEPAASRS